MTYKIFKIFFSTWLPGKERGNTLLLGLVIMPVLLGMAGLVLDWGRGVWIRTQLQKAADAGALAGAAALPDIDLAREQASTRVAANFTDPDDEVYAVSGEEYTVDLTVNVPTLFMRLLGHDSMEVSVTATAITSQPTGGLRKGGFPIAIINPDLNNDPCDDLTEWNYGRPYIIGYGEDNVMVEDWANGCDPCPTSPGNGHGNGENSRGWRGALALGSDGSFGGAGANDLRDVMMNGFPGEINIGDLLPMKFGNMAGPMRDGREGLLGDDPLPWDEFDQELDADCSRVVMVPIVHLINESRGDTYTVADFYNSAAWEHGDIVVDGFAPFFILTQDEADEYLDVHGNSMDWVLGFFIPGVRTHNFLPAQDGETVPEWGLYDPPRLIE
jgi:hypothetical protein